MAALLPPMVAVHQEVHLTVDTSEDAQQLLYGWTELHLHCATQLGMLALNCMGLQISAVSVQGFPASFQLGASSDAAANLKIPDEGQTLEVLAERSYDQYRSSAKREQGPQLFIRVPKEAIAAAEAAAVAAAGQAAAAAAAARDGDGPCAMDVDTSAPTASQGAPSSSQAPLLTPQKHRNGVSTAAIAEPPLSGYCQLHLLVHFARLRSGDGVMVHAGILASDPSLGRAGALFPCIDNLNSLHTYDLHISVPPQDTAVCSGRLAGSTTLRIAPEPPPPPPTPPIPAHAAAPSPAVVPGGPGSRATGGPTSSAPAMQLTAADVLSPSGSARGTVPTPSGSNTPVTAVGPGAYGRVASTPAATTPAAPKLLRTFHYEVSQPMPARLIALVAGPLAVWPHPSDHTAEKLLGQATVKGTAITHFAPLGFERLLSAATHFVHLPFELFERQLAVGGALLCQFPMQQLNMVFVPGELAVEPVRTAAGMIVASADLLADDAHFEQSVECKLALAAAIARQWFGVVLLAASPADVWVMDGLAAHLEDAFIQRLLGTNELLYRRYKERQAIVLADNGQAPPLNAGPKPIHEHVAKAALAAAPAPDQVTTTVVDSSHGTEQLDPGHLRRWKAAAVMRMLAKKAGEDVFRRLVNGMVYEAVRVLTTPPHPLLSAALMAQAVRLVSTESFIKALQGVSGVKKGITAFFDRWVYGRGCPRITVGWAYTKRTNTIELAIEQTGGPAAKAAAAAAAAHKTQNIAQRGIKVAIHMADGSVQEELVDELGPDEHLALHSAVLASSKTGAVKKKGGRKNPAEAEAAAAAAAAEEAKGAHRTPVLYIRVDPEQELLCDMRVQQGEGVDQAEVAWAAQLEQSKDVVAQSEAVAGLLVLWKVRDDMMAPTDGVVAALHACLISPTTFCRVRAEAALALGATTSMFNSYQGIPMLHRFFHDQCYDKESLQLQPNNFLDMATHIVLQAVPLALSRCLNDEYQSHQEAYDLVMSLLESSDNFGNPYDDSTYIASLLDALGNLRVRSRSQAAALLRQLDRWLLLDSIATSHHQVIACAALHAATNLTVHFSAPEREQEQSVEVRRRLLKLLLPYTEPRHSSHHIRKAAHECLLNLAAAIPTDGGQGPASTMTTDDDPTAALESRLLVGGLAGMLTTALYLYEKEPSTALRAGLLLDMLRHTGNFEAKDTLPVLPPALASQLYRLLHHASNSNVRLRHFAFMLLQRLAGRVPMLYRERQVVGPPPVPTIALGRAMGLAAASGMGKASGGSRSKSAGGSAAAAGMGGGGSPAGSAGGAAASAPIRRMKIRRSAAAASGAAPSASVMSDGGRSGAPGSPSRSNFTAATTANKPAESQDTVHPAASARPATSVYGPSNPNQPPEAEVASRAQADNSILAGASNVRRQPSACDRSAEPTVAGRSLLTGGSSPSRDPRRDPRLQIPADDIAPSAPPAFTGPPVQPASQQVYSPRSKSAQPAERSTLSGGAGSRPGLSPSKHKATTPQPSALDHAAAAGAAAPQQGIVNAVSVAVAPIQLDSSAGDSAHVVPMAQRAKATAAVSAAPPSVPPPSLQPTTSQLPPAPSPPQQATTGAATDAGASRAAAATAPAAARPASAGGLKVRVKRPAAELDSEAQPGQFAHVVSTMPPAAVAAFAEASAVAVASALAASVGGVQSVLPGGTAVPAPDDSVVRKKPGLKVKFGKIKLKTTTPTEGGG